MRQIKLAPKLVNTLNESWSPLRSRTYEQQQSKKAGQQTTSTASPNEKFYNALGLTSSASTEDVRNAYHKLALEYHPDLAKNTGNKSFCEHKMAEINEAYKKITALK
ncbi:MAG: DnaJ domain-containing protein [Paludibacteraceae bacterium]|nr:DnaJ domain-containing protein [Paludibacteraceae bacterium]